MFLSSIAAKVIGENLNSELETPKVYAPILPSNWTGITKEMKVKYTGERYLVHSMIMLFISSPADLSSPESTLRTLICPRNGKQASANLSLAA